jgi:branched-chain amino acid transport system substrate-binding protein
MTISRRTFLTVGAAGLAMPWVAKMSFAADTIKLGALIETSGPLEIYGRPMADVLDLAVDQINKAGGLLGKQVELVKYDPQGNMQLYTQYATQLSTKDNVDAVIEGVSSASREAVRPVFRRYQKLMFFPPQYEGGVCDRNMFATGSTPAQQTDFLIPYAIKKFGPKIYIIAADYNYGTNSAAWVKKTTKESGGEVVGEDYFPLDVTQFGPLIENIQRTKPDMVMSILVGGNHMSFYRQWAAAGMSGKIPIISTCFGVGNEHIVLTPEESDGIEGAYTYFQEIDSPANKAFLADFRALKGDNGTYINAIPVATWYAAKHWADGVTKAGSTDRMKVIEALEAGSTIEGPGGISKIEPKTHHVVVDVHLGVVKNHGFQIIESWPQVPPKDTMASCDLSANPDDTQQYVPDVK